MSSPLEDVEFLARSGNRVAVLETLSGRTLSRRDLEDELGVSRVTIGRILSDMEDRGWVVRTASDYELTPIGALVEREFSGLLGSMEAIHHVGGIGTSIPLDEFDADLEWFVDATITVAKPGDPYGPLNRFTTLLAETDSLRGIDTTTVSPTYVDVIYDRILDGMPVEVVYDPGVIDTIATEYSDLAAEAFDRDNLRLRIHEDVPFGLALFDDRVALGGYADDTGLLQVFVDTDDPDAIAWGTRLFESFRDDATTL